MEQSTARKEAAQWYYERRTLPWGNCTSFMGELAFQLERHDEGGVRARANNELCGSVIRMAGLDQSLKHIRVHPFAGWNAKSISEAHSVLAGSVLCVTQARPALIIHCLACFYAFCFHRKYLTTAPPMIVQDLETTGLAPNTLCPGVV